jgi:hypothetical protein
MEAVVAQSLVGKTLQGRGVGRAAEGARLAEADIVEQHQQHVRRARRGAGKAMTSASESA